MASKTFPWTTMLALYHLCTTNEACTVGYSPCGSGVEGAICSSEDEAIIAFSAGSKWLYRTKSGGIDMVCDIATFSILGISPSKECCKLTSDLSGTSGLFPVVNTISCGETRSTHWDFYQDGSLDSIYFKFTPNNQQIYTFTDCASSFNTLMFIRDSEGNTPTNFGCDDRYGCGCINNDKAFAISLSPGVYYIETLPYSAYYNGWYHLSIYSDDCPLPPTTALPTPSPITIAPTKRPIFPTLTPTGSVQRKCGKNTCYDLDVYPTIDGMISHTVYITDEFTGKETTFDIMLTIHNNDCIHPAITFMYEPIDYDTATEFMELLDNDGSLLTRCGGSSLTPVACGSWISCTSFQTLAANQINSGTSDYKVSVFITPPVEPLCNHNWVINAGLTIMCSPLPYTPHPTTASPTPLPLILPTHQPTIHVQNIYMDIYPMDNAVTSHVIGITNTDDNTDTYFDINIHVRDYDCVFPAINFTFENIDFGSNYEFLEILDENAVVIGHCSGTKDSGCNEWIDCFSSPQSIGISKLTKDDNYIVTVFEPRTIDDLCRSYHNYSINAELTIICFDGTAPPSVSPTAPPTMYTPWIKNIFIDLYPVNSATTSTTVSITNPDLDRSTYINLHLTVHDNQCPNPKITFIFEELDFLSDTEYLQVIDNDGTVLLFCTGAVDEGCDNWIECLPSPQVLGVTQIYPTDSYTITVFGSAALDAPPCSDNAINANLTIICDAVPPTTSPIPVPTISPTSPTIIPTISPTLLPTLPTISPTVLPTISPIPTMFISTISPTLLPTHNPTQFIAETASPTTNVMSSIYSTVTDTLEVIDDPTAHPMIGPTFDLTEPTIDRGDDMTTEYTDDVNDKGIGDGKSANSDSLYVIIPSIIAVLCVCALFIAVKMYRSTEENTETMVSAMEETVGGNIEMAMNDGKVSPIPQGVDRLSVADFPDLPDLPELPQEPQTFSRLKLEPVGSGTASIGLDINEFNVTPRSEHYVVSPTPGEEKSEENKSKGEENGEESSSFTMNSAYEKSQKTDEEDGYHETARKDILQNEDDLL